MKHLFLYIFCLLFTFTASAQIGSGGIGSSSITNDIEYLYWCDEVNGVQQTVYEIRKGTKSLGFYTEDGDLHQPTKTATLGECSDKLLLDKRCFVDSDGNTYTVYFYTDGSQDVFVLNGTELEPGILPQIGVNEICCDDCSPCFYYAGCFPTFVAGGQFVHQVLLSDGTIAPLNYPISYFNLGNELTTLYGGYVVEVESSNANAIAGCGPFPNLSEYQFYNLSVEIAEITFNNNFTLEVKQSASCNTSDDYEYIFWCDTINGEYRTIYELKNGNQSEGFYTANGDDHTLSGLATLGACNDLIQVCDTCVSDVQLGLNQLTLCPSDAVFVEASSPTWLPVDFDATNTLAEDASGFLDCSGDTPVNSNIDLINAKLSFDFSQLPSCAENVNIEIEVTATPNGSGFGLYAYDQTDLAAGTITTANGNQAEYQQFNATNILNIAGVTFTPAQPLPQPGSGTYTVSVPYSGLTASQLANFRFGILVLDAEDIIHSVVANIEYECNVVPEAKKYLNVVIDTACQAPLPIIGEVTIVPEPPKEECEGEYFLLCDDVNGDGEGEVLYYDYVVTCTLNGVISNRFTTSVDVDYQPYNPVNPTTNCDPAILPPVEKHILCDDGNNNEPFFQYSYVADGNVIVTNQTELDEVTPYVLVGNAVICPEKVLLDRKCFITEFEDIVQVYYFTDGSDEVRVYAPNGTFSILTNPPRLIHEVCCDVCFDCIQYGGCFDPRVALITEITLADGTILDLPYPLNANGVVAELEALYGGQISYPSGTTGTFNCGSGTNIHEFQMTNLEVEIGSITINGNVVEFEKIGNCGDLNNNIDLPIVACDTICSINEDPKRIIAENVPGTYSITVDSDCGSFSQSFSFSSNTNLQTQVNNWLESLFGGSVVTEFNSGSPIGTFGITATGLNCSIDRFVFTNSAQPASSSRYNVTTSVCEAEEALNSKICNTEELYQPIVDAIELPQITCEQDSCFLRGTLPGSNWASRFGVNGSVSGNIGTITSGGFVTANFNTWVSTQLTSVLQISHPTIGTLVLYRAALANININTYEYDYTLVPDWAKACTSTLDDIEAFDAAAALVVDGGFHERQLIRVTYEQEAVASKVLNPEDIYQPIIDAMGTWPKVADVNWDYCVGNQTVKIVTFTDNTTIVYDLAGNEISNPILGCCDCSTANMFLYPNYSNFVLGEPAQKFTSAGLANLADDDLNCNSATGLQYNIEVYYEGTTYTSVSAVYTPNNNPEDLLQVIANAITAANAPSVTGYVNTVGGGGTSADIAIEYEGPADVGVQIHEIIVGCGTTTRYWGFSIQTDGTTVDCYYNANRSFPYNSSGGCTGDSDVVSGNL